MKVCSGRGECEKLCSGGVVVKKCVRASDALIKCVRGEMADPWIISRQDITVLPSHWMCVCEKVVSRQCGDGSVTKSISLTKYILPQQ